jgi:hypothetical protein
VCSPVSPTGDHSRARLTVIGAYRPCHAVSCSTILAPQRRRCDGAPHQAPSSWLRAGLRAVPQPPFVVGQKSPHDGERDVAWRCVRPGALPPPCALAAWRCAAARGGVLLSCALVRVTRAPLLPPNFSFFLTMDFVTRAASSLGPGLRRGFVPGLRRGLKPPSQPRILVNPT